MITAYLSDRRGVVAAVLRDFNVAPYYPPATVGAAWVEVWVRNKDRGVDAAVKVGVFKPGSDVDFNVGALGSRDLLVTAIPFSAAGVPSVSDLNHADWHELNFTPSAATAAGFDEHVPEVSEAPTVTKSDNADEWIVFTPAPDAYGATLTGCDVYVEKASDATVFEVWPMGVAYNHRIDQKTYACRIRYRWHSQSPEDAGDGRGVSAWSPYSNAAEIGAGSPDPSPSTILPSFDPDPHDARAGVQTDVLT